MEGAAAAGVALSRGTEMGMPAKREYRHHHSPRPYQAAAKWESIATLTPASN